jgi:hypothetical protein
MLPCAPVQARLLGSKIGLFGLLVNPFELLKIALNPCEANQQV